MPGLTIQGAIPFSQFMELALYDPQNGYYSKPPSDDYYTSVDVHPIFARILARFFFKTWTEKLEVKPFSIIELGAGKGNLAQEVLTALSQGFPDCYNALTYVCVEKGSERRKSCQALQARFPGKLKAQEEFDFLENSFYGFVYSNEFFDALPFDRVIKKNGRIWEILVGPEGVEILKQPRPEIKDYFSWLGEEPQEGCAGEAHLASRDWMARIGRALRTGMVLSIDYGFEAKELYSEFRAEGTALCHFRHQTNRNFYRRPFDQDITAHVNFTTLMKEGEAWGLKSEKLLTQSKFLFDNGLEEIVRTVQESPDERRKLKDTSAIKSLIHPEGMGGTFKVLVQSK